MIHSAKLHNGMIKRLVIAGVISFWLVMNIALVRLWLDPESSDILSVPVDHVVRQIFAHEQPSELVAFQNGNRIGNVALTPIQMEDNSKALRFSGDAMPQIPMLGARAYRWQGSARLSSGFELESLRIQVDSRTPNANVLVEAQAQTKKITYRVITANLEPLTGEVTMDLDGLKKFLPRLGVGPEVLAPEVLDQIFANARDAHQKLRIKARQVQAKVREEKVEVFRIGFIQDETPLVEIDVSQLGQVTSVKTAFGFTLAPDDLMP
jgi:hypothetical protein